MVNVFRFLLSAVSLMAAVASAQTAYPDHPVTMIVPFPPGGVADITARPVAEAMSRMLKQPVIVENKAGAGGGVGMSYVAKAKPDGYTLLMALSSISIIPEADRILGRAPMYQLNQLLPVARFTADPTVLAVRADSPWKNVGDLIDAAKKAPGAIPYGSSGNYGTMHVPMEMFASVAGIRLLHVPYTGAGPAVIGLLAGSVDAISSGPSTVVGHVKAGKIRILASWGEMRHPALPDVPTFNELGYKVQFSQWTGLFAPAGTPEPVVAKLREAARTAVQDERMKSIFAHIETPLQYLDAPEFANFWDRDARMLADVVRRIGKVE